MRLYLDFMDAPARMTQVSAGSAHTCGISGAGALVCWGTNTFGELGVGYFTDRHLPTSVQSAGTWSQISNGALHSCAIDQLGKIFCWGSNGSAELAITPKILLKSTLPVAILSDKTWLKLSAGSEHNCAIAEGHSLWCWGRNSDGQLGVLTTIDPAPEPQHVLPTKKFVELDSGDLHSCAIDENQDIYCWGNNSSGQLGIPPNLGSNPLSPFAPDIPDRANIKWLALSSGKTNTCAITNIHDLWCAGSDLFGQLGPGEGAIIRKIAPTGAWEQVTVHLRHVCAIRTDQSLWCWGDNSSGQLGTGEEFRHKNPAPAQIKVKKNAGGELLKWTQVTTGARHTCAIDELNRAWCWGDKADGKLGNGGSMGQENLPVMITAAP